MNIINLTPYRISLRAESGEIINIPPSGTVAEIRTRTEDAGVIKIGGLEFPATRHVAEEIVGVPAPVACAFCSGTGKFNPNLDDADAYHCADCDGTGIDTVNGPRYIVSMPVKRAFPQRPDVLGLGEVIFNGYGTALAYAGFQV
jgi:hypothetical protein